MSTNKQIVLWTDRPPFFTKTPFLYLAKKGYKVTFLYRRDDEQIDRISVHGDNEYEDCEFINSNEILKSKESLFNYLQSIPNSIHIVNGFYLKKDVSYKEIKENFPNLKFYLLSEIPQTFRKPTWFFNVFSHMASIIRTIKNRKYINGVFALGEDACSYFIKHGWQKEKVHNYIYTFDFSKNGGVSVTIENHSLPVNFLYIGRFDYTIKGVNYLLKAIDSLDENTTQKSHFSFIGGYGNNSTEIIEFIDSHNNCSFLGQLPFNDVFSKIREADCIIVPSVKDGWNINVLQSLCCGKPVITTNGAGSHNLVNAFNYGVVVKKRSAKELSLAISQIVGNEPLYLIYCNNALKYSKYFTSESITEYIELIITGKNGELY